MTTATLTPQPNDLVQDRFGYFYRVDSAGGFVTMSDLDGHTASSVDAPVVLVRDGVSTGLGDRLATRMAIFLAEKGR